MTAISKSIKFVGVNDFKIDLFEGQFPVPKGMSYNSYIIIDEKIAVLDSVDKNFGSQWISNIKSQLNGRNPDYLVVHHMEMDHSANIKLFTEEFPKAKILASKLAFVIMKNLFDYDFSEKQITVDEGFSLSLGKHNLQFISAPNVHWPEVVMSFESTEKILFSADAFGTFGAINLEDNLQDDKEIENPSIENWLPEARRYYFGIVGKFGSSVQNVLKKLSQFEIEKICPLHGPVLQENLKKYIGFYEKWSAYKPESEGIFIGYTSVYGNTKSAVEKLVDFLQTKSPLEIVVRDISRCDFSEAIALAFRYHKLVLATTTYANDIFPAMKEFIQHLTSRNFQNRKIALIGNGSWNPVANQIMTNMLENCKNVTILEKPVIIKTGLNQESLENLEKLAETLAF